MHGTATIESFTVDGEPVEECSTEVGAPRRRPIINTATAVKQIERGRGQLTMTFRAAGPTPTPASAPTTSRPPCRCSSGGSPTSCPICRPGASGLFRVAPAGALAESVPFRGPSGVLIDFTAFARNASQGNTDTLVYIWARADTPQRILGQLAARGMSNPTTEAQTKRVLDQDAFALALRLYVVVTVLVILLALAGLAANLAVQLPARRRDAASLRVVGVKRRAVMIGVVAEFVVVLGAAALAGVAAGGVAQYVVVRTVTLGFVDSSLVPRVVPSFDIGSAVALSAVVLAVLVVSASCFAFLTVRGARTSSLRENAR